MSILENFQVEVIKVREDLANDTEWIVQKYEKEDFPNGSVLIVPQATSAVFINYASAGSSIEATGKGNAQVSVFAGPKEYRLETGESRFAPFRKLTNSLTGNESAFHSEVYFIKNVYMKDLTWGAGFEMNDPETSLQIHVGSSGRLGIHIENDPAVCAVQCRKFIEKVVGVRSDFCKSDLVDFFDDKIRMYVPDLVANYMENNQLGILHMTTKLRLLSEEIQKELTEHFNDFGVTLDSFAFNNISAREEDLALIKKKKQESLAKAIEMDTLSAAEARKREREGYTYQQEHSFEVLNTAAGNKGTASSAMGIGMGLGMGGAVGGIFGGGLAAMANNTFNANGGVFQNQAPNQAQPQNAQAPAEEKITCPSCQGQISKGSKFCVLCGAKLAQENVCPQCGKPVAPGTKFCPECGCKLIKTCPNCGKEVDGKFCPECGTKID